MLVEDGVPEVSVVLLEDRFESLSVQLRDGDHKVRWFLVVALLQELFRGQE